MATPSTSRSGRPRGTAASSVIISDGHDAKGGRIFEHGADQKYLRLFFERHASADQRPLIEQRRGLGVAMTLQTFSEAQPHAKGFFKDFVQPIGFKDLIAIQLLRSGRRVGWLSTARSGIQPRFAEQDLQMMNLLSPHLCRALALSDAIDLANLTSLRLEQTVNALSAGVFLTDAAGRIVYMNRSAERLIHTGNALQVVNHRLTASHRGADAALAQMLAAKSWKDKSWKNRSWKGAAADRGASVLALPDGIGSGYLASVLPLDGGARRELMAPFRASTALFVQDPHAAPQTEGEAFARLYGLTGAELKVLLALAPGLGAKDAARELGLREPTIRTHLQRVYAKTGVSRQSELVRLLLSHMSLLRRQ